MNLYFQNLQGKLSLIAQPTSDKEVHTAINKFLYEHNFKSYYTRCWIDEKGNKWMDVGSHTEFFICTENELDENEFTSGE